MGSSGKCLVWLTALTSASLTLTGCHLPDGVSPAAANPPASSAADRSREVDTLVHRRHGMAAPRVPATVSANAPAAVPPARESVLVISDGSDVVRVAGHAVRYPGSVTDAVVSPNGAVIAFVDGLGNIATARLDGTGVRVLTSTDPGVRRVQPTFEDGGSEIVFSERGHDGVWRLKEVAADGHDDLTADKPDPTVAETASDVGDDTAPSATWFQPSHTQAARSVLVFEHRTPRGRLEIYLADRNQRGFGSSPLLPGRAPAVSPTGEQVAFIGAAGQIHVERLVDGKHHATQVTWGARPTGHLAWSPDGRRIVFSTSHDVESVSSTPLRPRRNPLRIVLAHPGVASLGISTRLIVGTYPSTDPVQAALAVSRAHFVDGTDIPVDETSAEGISWADHVTLVSTADPTAAPAAAAVASGGPILFVRDGRLSPEVRDEILRLLQHPRHFGRPGTVDIVAGPTDVPDSIASELRAAHLRVRRFDPSTAATDAAAATAGGFYSTYVVVSRNDLPAIASSVSGTDPVLLTDGATMPPATAARLDRMPHDAGAPATVYAVGREAQAAVRSSWAGKRSFRIVDVGGRDRSGDSLAAVQRLYDAPGHLSVTTAASWSDLLIAGMVGPVLAVDGVHSLTPATRTRLAASQAVLRAVYVFGPSPALADTVGRAVYGGRYAVRRSPADITG
jgi:hypothetical protein